MIPAIKGDPTAGSKMDSTITPYAGTAFDPVPKRGRTKENPNPEAKQSGPEGPTNRLHSMRAAVPSWQNKSQRRRMKKTKFIEDREQLEKLAPVMKAPIRRHVFVCTGKSCSQVGAADVKKEFERILQEKGIRQGKESKGRNPMGEIVLTECGSVGFCSIGVAVLVYPDGIWYGQVTADDVREIIEKHLENGEIVERLALINIPQ